MLHRTNSSYAGTPHMHSTPKLHKDISENPAKLRAAETLMLISFLVRPFHYEALPTSTEVDGA